MRINNQTPVSSTSSTTPSTGRSDNTTLGATPSSAAAQPGSPSSSPTISSQDYGMVPSFEMQTLTGLLAEVPPVRQSVLADTIRRLTSGALQTASALEQTADAILGQ
ncbi:MAG TPA: hypothetical protein VMG10_17035 [Gemmataceae bacterium]|nr:hypothetical protein [Gemmataceae bacterium]